MQMMHWRPTKAQLKALHALYKRSADSKRMTYRQFRRTAHKMVCDDCLLVPFCGMIVGIETDGYTHS